MTRTFVKVVVVVIVGFFVLSYMSNMAHGSPSPLSLSVSLPASRPPVGSSLASSSILGRPSLSVDFINRVFKAYHSPAQGLGSVLYADSVAYGIDDAFALSFFLHESTMGTIGWAVVNHSLGNIRCTAGWSCNGGYRFYASWSAGFVDWFRLLVSEYLPRHLTTPASIIPVYAPPSDNNNDDAYIAAVCKAVSVWRSGRLVV
jgi:hypothetical protein